MKFARERPVLMTSIHCQDGCPLEPKQQCTSSLLMGYPDLCYLSIHRVALYLAIKRARVQPASVHSNPNQSQQTHQPVCFIISCHIKSSDSDVVPDTPQEVPFSQLKVRSKKNPLAKPFGMRPEICRDMFFVCFFNPKKMLIRVELHKHVSWVDTWI